MNTFASFCDAFFIATDRCYTRWQQQVYRRELDKQVIDKKKRLKEEKERERLECEKKQKEMMMEQIKLSKSIAEQIRRYQRNVRKMI